MKKIVNLSILVSTLLILGLIACTNTSASTKRSTLRLSISGLEPLTNGLLYEGWVIIDDKPVTTGKFNVSNGKIVDALGKEISNGDFNVGQDLSTASKIVITIEPKGDNNTIPADTKILAGDISNNAAQLTVEATLGSFGNSKGKYILATPTNGNSKKPTILHLSVNGLEPLANGLFYEGWAIIDGKPITTGKFNINAKNRKIVDVSGKVVPNGDFNVGKDLSAASKIVITIEPKGDKDTTPADTKILAGDISNNAASLTAEATIGSFTNSSGKYILATPTNGNSSKPTVLQLAVNGLEPLANGLLYEGWVIIDGKPITTGKFNVKNGKIVDVSGKVVPNGDFDVNRDLSNVSKVVITIEPKGDSDTVPANTKILAGNISNNAGSLTVEEILGSFDNSKGKYILATPTNGNNTNELSGIWFLDPAAGPGAGLDLPTLPNGWKYEGWTVINGTPVTSGKFTALNAVDESAPFSGSQAGPPFPGEDYLKNAPAGLTFPTNLSSQKIVVSIEPEPDDSSAPFTLKPLVGDVPANAMDHKVYELGKNLGSFPTASAKIKTKDNNDELSGVWFLDPAAGPGAGLNLPTLPAGWKYEGWTVINGTPVTSGKFTTVDAVDESAPFSGPQAGPPFPGEDYLQNAPASLTFPTNLRNQKVVVSIEPEPDDSSAPFTFKPLTGDIPADAVDHKVYELGKNLNSFPTANAEIKSRGNTDELSGVWFLDPTAGPGAGLNLPKLPNGWKYEGWTVINGIPVTSGKFTALNAADESAPFSGSQAGPPFPGEDYLKNAPAGLTFPTNLSSQKIVVSIEPEPDDSSAPFTLKPLVGDVPANAIDHKVYELGKNLVSFPSISAEIR